MDIATNRRALHDFQILERHEAGMELKGTEVKSIRAGHATLNSAFARIENGQLWLFGCDIQPYGSASHEQHDPKRQRRLLMHSREIDKLFAQTAIKGHTIVGLRMYWKGHRVKIELGVGKGKLAHDKRDDLKKHAEKRETDREIAHHQKRHN
jgi:SsrA-binding protein